jgi:hypothetical protein
MSTTNGASRTQKSAMAALADGFGAGEIPERAAKDDGEFPERVPRLPAVQVGARRLR